jgi:hypothetical protein
MPVEAQLGRVGRARTELETEGAEVLALAVSLEEEDARIFQEFARLIQVVVGGLLVFLAGILIGSD